MEYLPDYALGYTAMGIELLILMVVAYFMWVDEPDHLIKSHTERKK